MTAQQEPVAALAASAPPVDTSPIYKALIEARLALLAVNSFASQVAIGLIDKVLNAAPDDASAPALQAAPDKWIFDPHNPGHGMKLNPEWLKLHGLTAKEAALQAGQGEPAFSVHQIAGSCIRVGINDDLFNKLIADLKTTLPPTQRAAPAPEPVHVEAVASVVHDYADDGVKLDWLVEGGISSLPEGVTLYVADRPITDDNGSGEVYLAPSQPVAAEGVTDTHAFKNFHRVLCDRFDYVHDERDWRRDQVSLIEHIAKRLAPAPACEHCGGTGQIFGHADNCDDDLCALNGDQHSCAGKLEPCSCSAPTAPDIPPGCEMARGWAVEVSAQGDRVLLLSDVGYSGLADIEPWASTIRGCAEHLQAFIGPADGAAAELESLEAGEADAKEPHPCAHGCRHALNGEGLAPQCFVGCRRAMKEGTKR